MWTCRKTLIALTGAIVFLPLFLLAQKAAETQISARAKQVHDRAIVIDTHADTTQRLLFDKTFEIGVAQKNGNLDIPRMREGGLDAEFFSIWVPGEVSGPAAVKRALDLIDRVHEAVRKHPSDLML